MREIKYQLLKNNDGECDLNQKGVKYYLQECKRHWLLKVLFICFVFVKAIYIISSFEKDNEKDINGTQTHVFENTTSIYDVTSEKPFSDFPSKSFQKQHDSLTKASLYNTSNIFTKSAANDAIPLTTTAADNYFETMNTMKKNTIDDINYDIDFTSEMAIDSKYDSRPTINYLNINSKTIIRQSTTKSYINKGLVVNLMATSTTTTTTIKPNVTTLIFKTPAVKISSAVEQRYFINTSHCHIPFVEPFTSDIRKIFKPQHYTGCTKDKPIVTSSFNELEGHYILHINYTVAAGLKKSTKKSKSIEEDLLCCYKQIVRSGSSKNVDNSFMLLPCINFPQQFEVPKHINGIIVNCKSKSKKSILQEDAFSFVQVNKTSIQQESQNPTIETRKHSILMIGIDTLSRINFRRNMPETFKYLVDNKWYELMGYNKVGDNTLPNLMPLLSGYTKVTTKKICNLTSVGGFDNCNFIWTTFKKNGYHTAYAEDSGKLSTFNYQLKGFKEPPTDYYFRPMDLALEKSMKIKRKFGMDYCVGRKQLGEYIYDYATQFANRFKNQSSFGFFWTNSFSHDSYDSSATMDKTMVNYFKGWEKQGIFENSVVMFFSDHGARWGPLLKLSQGFLEERLPMFFISVPKWFQQKYPHLVKNLEINQKRLVNAFDIHMTLQHLLTLSKGNYKIQQAFDCPKCQSIFQEIPENRTCDDASIPKAWCTCIPFKTESTRNKVIQTVAKLVIQEMNRYYKTQNLTSLCSPLQLKEITNAKRRYPEEWKSSNNTTTTYIIDFITKPLTNPNTKFSANVDYDERNNRIQLNIEDISRQSLYKNTAKCTDDAQTKKYCICKNSLKTKN